MRDDNLFSCSKVDDFSYMGGNGDLASAGNASDVIHTANIKYCG